MKIKIDNIKEIIFLILIVIVNLSFSLYYFEVKIISNSFVMAFFTNLLFFISGYLYIKLKNNNKINYEDKKILLFALIFFCVLEIYRTYELIDYKYWNLIVGWINYVSMSLTPVAILLLLVGYRRILK